MNAARLLKRLFSRDPSGWVSDVRATEELIALKQFDRAQLQIQKGLERFPDQLDLLTVATDLYRACGSREKSLEYSRRLISCHPDYWFGYGRAAEDLAALGRFDEAQCQIQEGIERIPGQLNLLAIATDLCRASDDRAKSLDFSLQLIAHHPDHWFGYGRAAEDLVGLKRFAEARLQIQQGLERLPGEANLLAIAVDVYRALGNREKSLEFSQCLITVCPGSWNGYVRVAEDLMALKRFDELKSFCQVAKSADLEIDIASIEDWEWASNAGSEALRDIQGGPVSALVGDFCQNRRMLIPIGDLCLAAQLVQDAGGRSFALPFDWTFANPAIIRRVIEADFADFLRLEYLQSCFPDRRMCGHSLYGRSNFFNHHDPSRDPDRSAFKRRVGRFREMLATQASDVLFFNVRLTAHDDDLADLLRVLPNNSKILSFVFLGDESHGRPVANLIESRILRVTFACDNRNTSFAKKGLHPSNYTDGRFLYCHYSRVAALSLLEMVLAGPDGSLEL